MNYTTALLVFAFLTIPLSAETPVQRELTQLQEQRAKALAAAAEPVNRRYQVALDQLLRRATQLNDLETAIKIREELKTLGTVSAVTGNLKARLTNSTWDWWQGQRLTFLANGKAKWSYDGSESFTWAVTSNESRTIEGLTSRGYKYKVTFDPTLTTGTILGDEGKTREMKIIPPQ